MNILDFEFTDKIVPDAFHGTTQEMAKEILKTQTFKKTRYPESYLGDGVYFYESSKGSAYKFASHRYNDNEIAVLQAKIQLGSCFDLHDIEHQKIFTYLKGVLEYRGKGKNMTDAFIVNYIATEVCPDIETVRCSIPKGLRHGTWRMLVNNGNIPCNNEIYICVRKRKNILDIKKAKGARL